MFGRKKNKPAGTQKKALSQNYWAYVRRQFKKNKRALISLYVVLFLAFIALFADFLANEKPIAAKYQGEWHFPVFKDYAVKMGVATWPQEFQNKEWRKIDFDWAWWPLIPYLPRNHDYGANFVGPLDQQMCSCLCSSGSSSYQNCLDDIACTLRVKIQTPSWREGMTTAETVQYCRKAEYSRWRHWLGTDDLGRDVMAGMIHGTRIAFLVGIVAMSISLIIGLILGAAAGFLGDKGLQMSRGRLWLNLLFLFFAFFYGFQSRATAMAEAFDISAGRFILSFLLGVLIFAGIMVIPNLLAIPLKRIGFFAKRIAIPVDILVTRFIEVVISIPVLVLILAVVAIAKPSIFNVMAVIGLVSWTGIARFVRAELLRVRQLEYIESAHALGYSQIRTIFRHALPNALSPVFIAVAFGIATAILVEAFLSFLGIGVPPETITWGKLLSISRTNASAWWMAIFPGFAIFITVTLFNLIGEGLTDALDPRLKQ